MNIEKKRNTQVTALSVFWGGDTEDYHKKCCSQSFFVSLTVKISSFPNVVISRTVFLWLYVYFLKITGTNYQKKKQHAWCNFVREVPPVFPSCERKRNTVHTTGFYCCFTRSEHSMNPSEKRYNTHLVFFLVFGSN